MIYAAYLYVCAVANSPDTQMDLNYLAMDMAEGDYLAAALDIIGILAPGGTGFGKLSKPIRKIVDKVLKWVDSKTIKGAKSAINISKLLDSASVLKKGGETVAGHALQKHAGRNPDIWGSISGNSTKINSTALQHINDIIEGSGVFKTIQSNGISFLEKMLPDGRGIRLNMDGTFKGFIDQFR